MARPAQYGRTMYHQNVRRVDHELDLGRPRGAAAAAVAVARARSGADVAGRVPRGDGPPAAGISNPVVGVGTPWGTH